MKRFLIFFTAFITFLNIIISAYMSYNTVDLAIRKCKCAIMNAYWFIIFFYFLFSGMFLIYSMLVIFEYARGQKFVYFIIGYLIATGLFVFGSFMYTKYLASKKCDCVKEEYKKTLRTITIVRLIMAIITAIVLVTWLIYTVSKKTFVR